MPLQPARARARRRAGEVADTRRRSRGLGLLLLSPEPPTIPLVLSAELNATVDHGPAEPLRLLRLLLNWDRAIWRQQAVVWHFLQRQWQRLGLQQRL